MSYILAVQIAQIRVMASCCTGIALVEKFGDFFKCSSKEMIAIA